MLRFTLFAGVVCYLALWLLPLAAQLRTALDAQLGTPRDLLLVALGAVLASCISRIRALMGPRRRGSGR